MALMKFLLSLIGLVLILESLPYIAFPQAMKSWLRQLSEMEAGLLRVVGLFSLAAGLAICFVAQKSGLF